ncbi:MAG: amidohydrolase family protein [Ilumatobacteraceae bacterium]
MSSHSGAAQALSGHALAGGTITLRHALLADGSIVDIHVVDGVVDRVGSPASDHLTDGDATTTIDLDGMLVLAAFAEPHAHLDKAFLAETVPNPSGDLMGAIMAMEAHRHLLTLDDTIERADRAVRLMLSNGVTAIRTHADCTIEHGLMSVEALIAVRERFRGRVHIEVCVLNGWPSTGPEGADQRALLRDAISLGVDLIGGCPHLESMPEAATDQFLELADAAGLGVDLHTDETLDPTVLALEHLAHRVLDSGFALPVTASHCVSLGMQPERRQREVAELVSAAGIDVVALPHTNLFLQGRGHAAPTPRGLTAVAALRAAGVNVVAGADNLQDPFNPVGRGDPLETAGLMIMASHLLPAEAADAVSEGVRATMRLAASGPRAGAVADLVALPSGSVREAIAMGPSGRIVFSAGRIVHDGRTLR